MPLPCISLLKSTCFWTLLNPGNFAYPQLTRLFYANLTVHRVNGTLTLVSKVKNTRIRLSPESLALILDLPTEIPTKEFPSRFECLSRARDEFFLKSQGPGSSSTLKPTHTALNLQAKLIFTILARCIFPRIHSRELVTENLLEILFLIMNGYEPDLPKLILDYMTHVSTSSRPMPLPYANLLPKIFEAFDIDTSGEEKQTYSGIVDEGCLERLGIVKNLRGQWFLRKDSKGKQVAEPNMSEDRLAAVETEIQDLRFDLSRMWSDVVIRQDQTHELLSMVNCKLDQMMLLNALTYTATGSIMPMEQETFDHVREKTGNVILNCENQVKKRPILRPTHSEPTILTVEQYGVVKKYRDVERQKQLAQMERDKVTRDALARWRKKCRDEVRRKYLPPNKQYPTFGEWVEEGAGICPPEDPNAPGAPGTSSDAGPSSAKKGKKAQKGKKKKAADGDSDSRP